MANVVIIGASSAIAEAAARRWAAQGDRLFLVARRAERLADMAADLTVRGACAVDTRVLDLCDSSRHEALVADLFETLGSVDVVLVAHGTLGDQPAAERSYATALQELTSNGLSVISLLTPLANRLQQQRRGVIAVIGSVAGDRGRQSNYVYGSAKALVATFLQGLRNRLYCHGVHVLTIKPGFVDTPMTAHLPKGPLWASSDAVAEGILKAIRKRRNVVYLPGFWCLIMLVIRHIPECVFKRMSL